MDDLLKGLTGGGSGQSNPAGGLGDLLGGLMGGGGLGSLLGAAGGSTTTGGSSAGGLAALIPTLLPAILGMLGGQGSGSSSTGLHQLVDSMQSNGLGHVAQSWVGNGDKQPISAAQVEQVFSSGQLAELAAKAGIPAGQVSAGIASILPHVVSSLTPDGKVPDAAQVQGAVGQLQQVLAGLTAGHA